MGGNAKKMLREIRAGRVVLEALEQKRAMVESRVTRTTRSLSGMPSSKGKTDLSGSIVGLLELDKAIEEQIEKVSQNESCAIKMISMVKDQRHRTLLILYYIAGDKPATWEDVAIKMNYSLPTVWRQHGFALQELQKILDAKCIENDSRTSDTMI